MSKSARNLGKILGPSTGPRCDDAAVGGGVPRWCSIRQKWIMWYYCRDKDFSIDVAPTLGSGRIAVALSDDALTWQRHDGPLFGGAVMEPSEKKSAFDSTHIGCLDAAFVDGKVYLAYLGGDHKRPEPINGSPMPKGLRMRSGLAKSEDGVTFTRVEGKGGDGAALDYLGHTFTSWPSLMHDGRHFYMSFTHVDLPHFKFGSALARSADGHDWSVLGELQFVDGANPKDSSGMMTRQILPNPGIGAGKWLMVYTGLDDTEAQSRSIMLAHGDDLLHWERISAEPILTSGDANAWDGGGVAAPQLVEHEGRWHLFYFGFPNSGVTGVSKGIGLALCDDIATLTFKRVVHPQQERLI